jgi:vibriolysin
MSDLRSSRLLGLAALAALATVAACEPGAINRGTGYPSDVQAALDALPRAEVVAVDEQGLPRFIRGDLGQVVLMYDNGPEAVAAALSGSLARITPVFRLVSSDLRLTKTSRDALGYLHARYQQQRDGLDVIGGELLVHLDAEGTIYAAHGLIPEVTLSSAPTISQSTAVSQAIKAAGGSFDFSPPRLVYVVSTLDESLHLAWETLQSGWVGDVPQRDLVYVDAHVGGVVDRRPLIHFAKNRKVYDVKHGTSLPGTLKISEGGASVSDTSIMSAYNYIGSTYDCYKTKYSRDSYDNAGAMLVGSVHYSTNYANAFWDGSEMVFGDGDGQELGDTTKGFDVIAHELTHAVTEHEANLAYQNEPGALNEAFSDIMAATCEAWLDGGVTSNTWMIGEDIWTPATPGDALRYMNNPTQDGQSYDYYPQRYTGSEDNGGVHLNSGIANLAFYLLSQGGTHPRAKTTVQVTGVGIDKAGAIFYRALTTYLSSNSNFSAARTATAQAATDLYGATVAQSVQQAWDAVGAPGGTSTTPPPSTTVTQLTNGVAKTGLSAAQNGQLFFSLAVPTGASNLTFKTSGGSGDADLYVRFGSMPTTSTNDYKSEGSTTAESVTAATATAGTWYVLVNAYAAFSNVSLVASYTTGSGGGGSTTVLTNGVPVTNLSGAKSSQTTWTFQVPSGQTSMTIKISGGSGDADLYVRYNAQPTTSTWDYRPYKSGNAETVTVSNPSAGTWYVMLRGYAAYAGVTLVASYQ